MYKLNSNIFYRRYEEETFVIDVKNNKYYIFNEIVYDILDFIYKTPGSSAEKIVLNILDIYSTEFAEGVSLDIAECLDELVAFEIVNEVSNIEHIMLRKAIEMRQLFNVLFELTYKCNERCIHCYAEEDTREPMSKDEIKNIIDQMAEMNVMNITFSGGEVFTREDFIEIFDYAIKKRLVVDIFSNGQMVTPEIIRHLADSGIRCFHTSIYSHKSEIHDKITGVKGSFEKTLSVIKGFSEKGCRTNIKTVMMKHNYHDIEGLLNLAKDTGSSLQVGLNITPKNSGDMQPTELRINSIKEYEKILYSLKRAENVVFPNNILEKQENDNICGAGACSISINPYGEVFPCNGLGIKIGDLKEKPLKEIWETSDELAKVRDIRWKDIKKCTKCTMRNYCSVCIGEAILENQGEIKEYEEACNLAQASYNIIKGKGGEENESI